MKLMAMYLYLTIKYSILPCRNKISVQYKIDVIKSGDNGCQSFVKYGKNKYLDK